MCCYQPIYTIGWNLGYPGHCYQPIYNMGCLHCCWQPNACARLFSVLLPTHLHYLVKSRLSRALLPTHLKHGLFVEYCFQAIYTTKWTPGPHRLLHRGAFCQFSFLYIYYYGRNKSTRKDTGNLHLCPLLPSQMRENSCNFLGNYFILLGNYFIWILFGFHAFICDTMVLKTIWWWY